VHASLPDKKGGAVLFATPIPFMRRLRDAYFAQH